jgi:uncharacterized protein (TIGR02466 family)
MPYLDIFPLAVSADSIAREFTEEEHKLVQAEYQSAMNNISNLMGANQYVLNRPEFADIREFIQEKIDNYLHEVYAPKNDLKIYITQSWLSWLKPGQEFHKHYHQNSLVSGCLYLNADRNQDAFKLHKEEYQQIYIPVDNEKLNKWNTQVATIPVNTGDLILFPSKLHHSVSPTQGEHIRTTLAFNTFIKGSIKEGFHLLDLDL